MSVTNEQKCLEIIRSTEMVADKILMNKQELLALDKRRQDNRQAIRSLERNERNEPEAEREKRTGEKERKVWITIGSLLVRMEREKALSLLKKGMEKRDKKLRISLLIFVKLFFSSILMFVNLFFFLFLSFRSNAN